MSTTKSNETLKSCYIPLGKSFPCVFVAFDNNAKRFAIELNSDRQTILQLDDSIQYFDNGTNLIHFYDNQITSLDIKTPIIDKIDFPNVMKSFVGKTLAKKTLKHNLLQLKKALAKHIKFKRSQLIIKHEDYSEFILAHINNKHPDLIDYNGNLYSGARLIQNPCNLNEIIVMGCFMDNNIIIFNIKTNKYRKLSDDDNYNAILPKSLLCRGHSVHIAPKFEDEKNNYIVSTGCIKDRNSKIAHFAIFDCQRMKFIKLTNDDSNNDSDHENDNDDDNDDENDLDLNTQFCIVDCSEKHLTHGYGCETILYEKWLILIGSSHKDTRNQLSIFELDNGDSKNNKNNHKHKYKYKYKYKFPKLVYSCKMKNRYFEHGLIYRKFQTRENKIELYIFGGLFSSFKKSFLGYSIDFNKIKNDFDSNIKNSNQFINKIDTSFFTKNLEKIGMHTGRWYSFSYSMIDGDYLIMTGGDQGDKYSNNQIFYFDFIGCNWYKCEKTLPTGLTAHKSIVISEYNSIHIFGQKMRDVGYNDPIHWKINLYDIISSLKWKAIRLIWIGYLKNSQNVKCKFSIVPKDIINYITSFCV